MSQLLFLVNNIEQLRAVQSELGVLDEFRVDYILRIVSSLAYDHLQDTIANFEDGGGKLIVLVGDVAVDCASQINCLTHKPVFACYLSDYASVLPAHQFSYWTGTVSKLANMCVELVKILALTDASLYQLLQENKRRTVAQVVWMNQSCKQESYGNKSE